MKHIGIIPNVLKDRHLEITAEIARYLTENGLNVYTTSEIARQLDSQVIILEEAALYESCDAIIAIGGDGTILSVAEKACVKDVPIVGVNLGRIGFLADIEPQDIEVCLQKLLNCDYTVEERMMLKATIIEPDGQEHVYHALNDVNITRDSFSRIVEFEIRVNNELSDFYRADGIIVSTPTGSTAYNLSAGGPIVVPHAKTYIITPICPHTIYSKSIMISDTDCVEIQTVEEEDKHMALSIDGKPKMYLMPNQVVHIEKSPYVTKLIKLSERKFFEILRAKIVERRR